MRASRPGSRSSSRTRSRTNARQSRISAIHHVVHGLDVELPDGTLIGQNPAARRRQSVETAIALARLFDPATLDPAAVFEPQERRIQRRQRKGQPAARPRLDELADLVAMARPGVDERQDQHLDAAFLQFGAEHGFASLYVGTRSM